MKKWSILSILVVLVMMLGSMTQAADDGPLFHRNISGTPHRITGASQMSTMWLYVPAQNTQGELVAIDYLAGDVESSTIAYTREEAKPLIITYNDGMTDEIPELDGLAQTGAGWGDRDAFAALSLDDGATWKHYNLSDSAQRSSFVLKNGEEYPGDVFKLVHAVEGNMVAAAWISRYCESGSPLYSWDTDNDLSTTEDSIQGLLDTYPELLDRVANIEDVGEVPVYTSDLFGVAGSQQSVDYTLQGFPEVAEIPYGCVWTARGTLEQDSATGLYDIVWRASERLTSGRRDPHQISITSSPGAGFVIFWQEDPEGLRPGKGLGPGEGWSGAIANSKTDIWYTFIDLEHFDDVVADDGTINTAPTADDLYAALTKPKVALPFALPVRITDNNQCKTARDNEDFSTTEEPYCFADFNDVEGADFCADSVEWTNPGGTTLQVCLTEDGRPLTGRTASTRVRAAMKSYDSDGDGASDSAWVLFGAEKMKALGTVGDDGCDPTTDPECTIYDIGKNMHYYTFEFDNPALVTQGLVLNSPAISPETGEFFDTYVDELTGAEIYDTEIARRFNLMVNSPAAMQDEDTTGTAGILVYKQGILFQGGPADIYIRRMVLPDTFDPAVDNPFDYANVECVSYDDAGVATVEDRLFPDGSNPNYVLGLCPVDGMNVSGTSLVACTEGDAETCADYFPFSSTYEEWFSEDSNIQIPKVLEWSQTVDNLNDASWENPYDVSKGHRGFIDGDFVMMMYATAANWKANTTGNEAYQLYIRRSFDGGQTWTTLPTDYTHWSELNPDVIIEANGSTSCEWYGGYGVEEYQTCTDYAAGDFEPAHNVSQLSGTRVTVLDPRYSPTGGMLKQDYTKLLCDGDLDGIWEICGTSSTGEIYPEDIRDPSGFFATFETGDNSVVTEETGTIPLDMYYSRASNFGDEWDEQDACATDVEWYPNSNIVCTEADQVELRWDWLENGPDLATEASVYGNPSGDRFYAVWNQELPVDPEVEIYTDMDSEFRRIFYNFTTDSDPVVTFVSVSSDRLELSTATEPEDFPLFVGDGRDTDRLGNVDASDLGVDNYKWWCDTTGHTFEGRVFQSPPNGWVPGKHDFHFQVQDNDGNLNPDGEGNWSRVKTVTIWVAEEFHDVFLPMAIR